MVSHSETGSDPPIGSDLESGCDISHHKIIKCVSFELIHYTINMDITSFCKVFSEFYFLFLYNVLLI